MATGSIIFDPDWERWPRQPRFTATDAYYICNSTGPTADPEARQKVLQSYMTVCTYCGNRNPLNSQCGSCGAWT